MAFNRRIFQVSRRQLRQWAVVSLMHSVSPPSTFSKVAHCDSSKSNNNKQCFTTKARKAPEVRKTCFINALLSIFRTTPVCMLSPFAC